jgi:hypothetical protein
VLIAVAAIGFSAGLAWTQEAGTASAELPTSQAPSPEPSAPAPAPAVAAPRPKPHPDTLWQGITGLVLQPPFTILRAPVAVFGALGSGLLWAVTGGGDAEGAKKLWDATVRNNWGWPEFVQMFTGPPAKGD